MAEVKVGDEFYGVLEGAGKVTFKVTDLLPGGRVELEGPGGRKQVVTMAALFPEAAGVSISTAPVVGLQPDPPAGIARAADRSTMNVLPSPIAPPSVILNNPMFTEAPIVLLEMRDAGE
jgi:hypothetical protein